MGGNGFRAGLVAAVLAGLAMPGVAEAGTAFVTGAPGARSVGYLAAPGEQGTVLVETTNEAPLVARFTEVSPNPVAAAPGCSVPDPAVRTVECALEVGDRLLVGTGDGADTIEGTVGFPMIIDAGPGDDVVRVGRFAGATEVIGGTGTDLVSYVERISFSVAVSLDGMANDGTQIEGDQIRDDVEIAEGTPLGDELEGNNGPQELRGAGGNDNLKGLGGPDLLSGGDGVDLLQGGDGGDILDPQGGCGDALAGGAGDDLLLLTSATCASDVQGGPGRDKLDLAGASSSGQYVSLDDVADDGLLEAEGTSNYHSDIEDVVGGSGGDLLVGSAAGNLLDGGAGEDLLAGEGGSDDLRGGAGEDAADYSLHTARVVLTLDGLANDGATGEDDLIGTDVEHLIGGSSHDELVGDGGDNALDGGVGADVLRGGDGFDVADYSTRSQGIRASLNDALADDGEVAEGDSIKGDVEGILGGEGRDELISGPGDDYLFGGDGVDSLTDTAGGEDVLEAGDGDDEVRSKDGRVDLVLCGEGRDFFDTDANDERDSCEVQLGGTPPPAPQNPEPPARPDVPRVPRPVAAADTRAPRAALFAQTGSGLVRRMARNDLRFRVGCDEPCRVIKATLKSTGSTTKSLRRRGFRRTTLVAQRTAPTGLAALHIVRVKRSTEGHRMLRALNSGRYVLRVVVADAAGNRTVVTRTVTVRR